MMDRRPRRGLISWPALALLTVGSVGYLGSAPTLSVFGLASVFLYVLPAFVFLLPVSLAYVIDPGLAGNGAYTAAVIVVLFWAGVLVCSRGVSFVTELSSAGTVIGTLVPAAVLVALGGAYLARATTRPRR